MTGEMAIMGPEGDTKTIWDADKPEEVENARRTFNELREKGYYAYQVKGDDASKGERMTEFDPDAERMIMAPPLMGG
jgi:hypothetical protein